MLTYTQVLSSLAYLAVAYCVITFNFRYDANSNCNKSQRLIRTLIVIALLSAVKVGYDIRELPDSLYGTLDIGRHSNTLDIRRAYKSLSKRYHPDKNPDSTVADEKFQAVKHAYDVLMDESQRDIYNRFGSADLEFDPRKDELKLISDIGVVYLFWMLTIYLLSITAGARASRTWMCILGIALMVLEVCFCLTDTSLPDWYQQTLTEHALLYYLHSLFPCCATALRCVAEYLYVDVDATSIAVIREVNNHHKTMGDLLLQLQDLVEMEKMSAVDDTLQTDSSKLEEIQNKLLELRDQMEQSSEYSVALIDELKKSSANPGASYYWIIFVMLYGGVYFMQ